MTETILTNALLVLPDRMLAGTIVLRDGLIADMTTGNTAVVGAIDCRGDLVMPGLIELHTDNLERHIEPRPKVNWPHAAAIVAHDAELAGVGITTVFDALRVGSVVSDTKINYGEYARALADEILDLRAGTCCVSAITCICGPRSALKHWLKNWQNSGHGMRLASSV